MNQPQQAEPEWALDGGRLYKGNIYVGLIATSARGVLLAALNAKPDADKAQLKWSVVARPLNRDVAFIYDGNGGLMFSGRQWGTILAHQVVGLHNAAIDAAISQANKGGISVSPGLIVPQARASDGSLMPPSTTKLLFEGGDEICPVTKEPPADSAHAEIPGASIAGSNAAGPGPTPAPAATWQDPLKSHKATACRFCGHPLDPDGLCSDCAERPPTEQKQWLSKAQWPKGTIGDENYSVDKHYTEAEAKGVCDLLEKHGFGGDGKVFPIRTWVEHRPILSPEPASMEEEARAFETVIERKLTIEIHRAAAFGKKVVSVDILPDILSLLTRVTERAVADFTRHHHNPIVAGKNADLDAGRAECARLTRDYRESVRQSDEGKNVLAGTIRELRVEVEELRKERDEAIAVFDAIDYHHIKVKSEGYRGNCGYSSYVADPGGPCQEERQKTIGHGGTPMEAIKEGLKHEGFDVTQMAALRSELRAEVARLTNELNLEIARRLTT